MLRPLTSSPLGITCVALALSLSPAAFAQTNASDTAKVTQLFKNGKAAFTKGDMAEAERLFSEAFALRKSSDIAANLAQSELEQQKFRAAAEHFQWALVNLLPSASDAQRKAVETGLARSRSEVAVLRLDIKPEGSDVLVSEQNLGKAPIPAGVYVDPGEVIVSVKHDGFVAIDKRVLAAKGTEQAVEVSLVAKDGAPVAEVGPAVDSGLQRDPQPTSPATPVADLGPTHKSLVPAFIATGVAVAGGVAGVVFMLDANSKASKADDLRDSLLKLGGCGKEGGAPTADCDTLNDQRKSVDSKRRLEIGAFVIGGVAALAAGYFYWDALGQPRRASAGGHAATRTAWLPTFNVGQTEGTKVDAVKLGLRGTF